MVLKERLTKLRDNVSNYFYKYDEYEEDTSVIMPQIKFNLHIKFFKIQKHENVDDIKQAIKEGNVMGIIDISLLHVKSFVHLRVITQKLRRCCEAEGAQMKFYGRNWILIIPDKLKFYKPKSKSDKHETGPKRY